MTFKHFFTALLILSSFAAQAQLDTTGLIAHWSFSGNFNDVTGRGHNGQLGYTLLTSSAPAPEIYRTGINGDTNAALQFRSNLIGGASYQPDLNLSKFSIAAVVYIDTFSGGEIFMRPSTLGIFTDPSYGLELWGSNLAPGVFFKTFSRWNMSYNDVLKLNYTPPTADSTWYYVVATYDGQHFKTYVNGILKTSFHKPNAHFDSSGLGVYISGHFDWQLLQYYNQFVGVLDDLRLYNRALPDSIIATYPFNFFDTAVVLNVANTDTVMCSGDSTIDIPYIVSQTFRTANKFTVQMSDTSGSFNNAIIIGSDSTNISGSIACTIPPNTISGYHRIRIVSTAPTDTTFEFIFNYHPAKNLHASTLGGNAGSISYYPPQNGFCKGDSILFVVDSLNGLGPASGYYQWQKNGINIPGANSEVYGTRSANDLDSFRCILISNHSCWVGDTVYSTYYTANIDTVTIPTVTIAIAPNDTMCFGDTFSIYVANRTNTGGASALSWRGLPHNGDTLVAYKHFTPDNLDTIYCTEVSNATCAPKGRFSSNRIVIHIDSNLIKPSLTINATFGGTVPIGADITFTSNFTGGGAAPTYQWLKNNNPIAGATNPNYIAIYPSLVTGDVITLRAKNTTDRCAKPNEIVSTPINIKYTNSISDVKTSSFKLYPNPNDGAFFIQLNDEVDEPINISILNTTGQTVFKKAMYVNNSNGISLSLPVNIPNGIYIIKLNTGTSTESKHITINR